MRESFRRSPSDPIGQNFEQRVCLKLVLPFFRDSNDFIELFEREARLAAKLRHSNIVGVIDFGRVEGDHPPLQQLAPDAPPEICNVIESLIKPNRDARPESAAILTELLGEFVLEQDATEVHSDSERDETGISQGSPTKTKTVRLRPGQRKTVSFDLTQ
jgi:hypothetical protein